jgi:hypothetical protein
MARKEVIIQIEREGRDVGKRFKIRELSAAQTEDFFGRLLSYLGRGIDVPKGSFSKESVETVFELGARSFGNLPWNDMRDLMAEMMACVHVMPDDNRPSFSRRIIIDPSNPDSDDIEEMLTYMQLREEWFDLHLGFSVRSYLWNWIGGSVASTNPSGANIETFPGRAAQ